ncbi:MAG TPA: TonB family protein, partial [Bryobacteraceae bacterium]|nr:TonB family protein [Bryobacteraceae bacterium]
RRTMFLALQNSGHRSRGVFLASASLHAVLIGTLAIIDGRLAAPSKSRHEEFILVVPAIHKETAPLRPKVPQKIFVLPALRKETTVELARMSPIPLPAVLGDPVLPAVPLPVMRVPDPPQVAPLAAPPPLPKPVKSAGFDPAGVRPTQPETVSRLRLPETAGFTAPAQLAGASPRTVSAGGFSGSQPAKAEQRRTLSLPSSGGFETAAATRPPVPSEKVSAKGAVDFTPVEITHKPRPTYTKEGRELQIEGEVLLQVIFSASGLVQVVRVSRALGHGLDEAAIAAAHAIRFRPAQRGGMAVDSPGVVHITFELAY